MSEKIVQLNEDVIKREWKEPGGDGGYRLSAWMTSFKAESVNKFAHNSWHCQKVNSIPGIYVCE